MRILCTALVTVLLLAPSPRAQGTATGTFTVKGKATKIAYAYAMSRPSPFDKSKPAIRLVLADVALTPKVLMADSPFEMQDLTRAGTLHAIEALIDVTDKAVLGTALYDAQFKMSSVSVAGTNITLELKTLDKTTIAGRLYTAKPDDFNDVPFQYDITFSAAIGK
jgi:hypothetical protein